MTVAETVTGRGTQSAPELIPLLDEAAEAATKLRDRAVEAVAAKVAPGGKIDGAALEREQHAAHGLAWIATYVEALRQLASYARRLDGRGPVRRDGEPARPDRAPPNISPSCPAA